MNIAVLTTNTMVIFLFAGLTTNTMVSVGAPLAQMSVTGSINGPVSSIGDYYDDTFYFTKM